MRSTRQTLTIISLLTAEAAALAWLAVQLVPARPLALQPDAFYSAFLSGGEGASAAIALVSAAGAALLAGGAALTLARAVARWRTRKLPATAAPAAQRPPADGQEERFDLHQRTQHLLALSSVAVLALTGLPQTATDWPGSGWLLGVFGGIEGARSAHRTAATVLDFAILYALGYLLVRAAAQRRIPTGLWPSLARLRGRRRARQPSAAAGQPPKFTGRQQLDFWAAAVSLPMLSLTGLALAHADLVAAALSPAALAFGVAVHRTVAVCFASYIVAVHLYHVAWSPEVFPLNTAMFTGRQRTPRTAAPEGVRPATGALTGAPDHARS